MKKCKVCEKEVADDEIIDLEKGKLICNSCAREITKLFLKEMLTEMELGIVDTILEKIL